MDKKKTQTEASPEVAEKEAVAEEAAEAAETAEEKASDERDTIIEELNKKLVEANDKYLRTVAEYDNFRKRSQKEKEAIFSDSKTDIIGKFLPVIDNLESGFRRNRPRKL